MFDSTGRKGGKGLGEAGAGGACLPLPKEAALAAVRGGRRPAPRPEPLPGLAPPPAPEPAD